MRNLSYQRQQGVVLIAALAVLIMLTLLAIGAFQAARQEEVISANHVQHSEAFQMAETGVEAILSNTGNFSSALVSDVTIHQEMGDIDVAHSIDATLHLEDSGPVPGYSFGTMVSYKYNLHGEGRLFEGDGATAAQSVIDQGAYILAPVATN